MGRTAKLILAGAVIAIALGVALGALTHFLRPAFDGGCSDDPLTADGGVGELRWLNDVETPGWPVKGCARQGFVILVPMDAHDQWWSAVRQPWVPMIEPERDGDRIRVPYGSSQSVHKQISVNVFDSIAEFATVSEVSGNGRFQVPDDPGVYWACVGEERQGSIWIVGCDVAELGHYPLILEEHMGFITALHTRTVLVPEANE